MAITVTNRKEDVVGSHRQTRGDVVASSSAAASFDTGLDKVDSIQLTPSPTTSPNVSGGTVTITPPVYVVAGTAALATVQDTSGDFLIATTDITTHTTDWHDATLEIEQAADDTLVAAFASDTLTLSLADTTPGNNNIAAIQALVDALGTVDGYDLTELTFSGTDWDDKQTGATLTTASDAFDTGVDQVTAAMAAIYFTAEGM